MKKNIIRVSLVSIILIMLLVISLIIYKYQKKANNNINDKKDTTNTSVTSVENDNDKNVIADTVICGIVEAKRKGYIYIFGGQHFDEYGYEIEEYTTSNINDKKQICIDYFTSEKYDTDYIEIGDLLICKGDLIQEKSLIEQNDFDTKNNEIIVLKSNDYNKMKENVLNEKEDTKLKITIGDVYNNPEYVYLEYDLEDNTHENTTYHFPFAIKVYITHKTEVKGELKKGKKVKVQYDDSNDGTDDIYDQLKLKSIEVIE